MIDLFRAFETRERIIMQTMTPASVPLRDASSPPTLYITNTSTSTSIID